MKFWIIQVYRWITNPMVEVPVFQDGMWVVNEMSYREYRRTYGY